MVKDDFVDWENDNHEDLVEKFFAKNVKIKDSFDEFTFEEFKEAEADKADYLYEMYKDQALEDGTYKEEK